MNLWISRKFCEIYEEIKSNSNSNSKFKNLFSKFFSGILIKKKYKNIQKVLKAL